MVLYQDVDKLAARCAMLQAAEEMPRDSRRHRQSANSGPSRTYSP